MVDLKNILILGAGGREHALADKVMRQNPSVILYYAAGIFPQDIIVNPAMAQIAQILSCDICDKQAVLDLCLEYKIDFVIIGPEAPLAAGVSDYLSDNNITLFGPSMAAAQLEVSKGFTKRLCHKMNIPTARYDICDDVISSLAALEKYSFPVVIKADGLAAGKGVVIADNDYQAKQAIEQMFDGKFGKSGKKIVIEAFLKGVEASFFVLSDGTNIIPLGSAQDHKRAFDDDKGPNTGGMGAFSPSPFMTDDITKKTLDKIIRPTIKAMQDAGTPYKGVLYAGLMICDNEPFLIEYNARFGDPECQILMQRLQSDLLPLLYNAATKMDDALDVSWSDQTAITVVMAANGYPENPQKGAEIILPNINADQGMIYHAGTVKKQDKILVNGGRVLNVTALGADLTEARNKAYDIIKEVKIDNIFYRTDIGKIT